MDPTQGFVAEFRGFVADLTTPEKRNIVALTEIARDAAQNRPQAVPGVADVIIERIFTAPPGMRLPALYLLDSIAKMVGEPYKAHFAPLLPGVFEASWNAGISRSALGKLAATWEGVFAPETVAAVRAVMHGPAQYSGGSQYPAPQYHGAPEPATVSYGTGYGGGSDEYGRAPYAGGESWAGYSGGGGGYGGYSEPADRAWLDYGRAEPAAQAPGYWDAPGYDTAYRGADYSRYQQYHHDDRAGGTAGYAHEPARATTYGTASAYEQPQTAHGRHGYGHRYIGSQAASHRTPSPAPVEAPRVVAASAVESGAEGRLPTPPPGMCHPVRRRDPSPAKVPTAGAPAVALPDLLSSLLASGVLSGLGGAGQAGGAGGAAGQQYPPTTDLSPEIVKRDNPGAVQRLLSSTAATKSAFLDVLFLRRAARGGSSLRMSRLWYVEPDAWLATAAGPAAPAAGADAGGDDGAVDLTVVDGGAADGTDGTPAEEPSVPVDEDQTSCALSGEALEQAWDEARQEWRYIGAVRLEGDEARKYGVAPGSIVLASSLGQAGMVPPALSAPGDASFAADGKNGKAMGEVDEKMAGEEPAQSIPAEDSAPVAVVDEPAHAAVKRDLEAEGEETTMLSPSMKRVKLENPAADA